MNKKLLILGVSALFVGFFCFTAFDGKTREQQMAEIEQMATMKLDELRAQKEQECTDRVDAEALRRFDELVAQREADVKAGKKPKPKPKPGSTGGSTVDPLPQATPPATTDPKKDKMEGGTKTQEKQDKMQGQPTTTDKKKEKMKSGGGGN
jgi:hypothetical protein